MLAASTAEKYANPEFLLHAVLILLAVAVNVVAASGAGLAGRAKNCFSSAAIRANKEWIGPHSAVPYELECWLGAPEG
jgi:hypothetical protein